MPQRMLLAELIAAHRRQGALVGVLAVLGALTEGLGLVLAVPLLGAVGATGAPAGLAGAFGTLGIGLGLAPLLAMFVGLVALRAALVQARIVASYRFETALVDGLRMRAWEALLHCDWRKLLTLRRSDGASLLISDIERVGWGVQQALAGIAMLITLGGIGLAALAIAPLLAVAVAVSGILLLSAYAGLRRRARALGQCLSAAQAAVHGSFDQGLAALRVIKSIEGEGRAAQDVEAGLVGLRRVSLAFRREQGLGQAALQIGGALVLAVVVWIAFSRWHLGAATVLPIIALFARSVPLLGALQDAWVQWSHARPALEAVLSLIAATEAAREPDAPCVTIPELRREIAFEQVTVRFEAGGAPAIDGISLTMPARGLVALIGPSGAGKSTFADLAGGLLSPDQGEVRIDGRLLDSAMRRAWRRQVAYVQQEPVLLAGTVRDNLVWAAPQADDTQLHAALAAAAADFVGAMPDGLDTRVGDGGRLLSGGERQRLMLARALLRKPALLILDEATSALDPANEAQIVRAISNLKQSMAILVIGHRGALLELADRTVSLDKGRIAAMAAKGAH